MNRSEGCHLAGNRPARALLLKLGFRLEGILRPRHDRGNRFEDRLYFDLLCEERLVRHPVTAGDSLAPARSG